MTEKNLVITHRFAEDQSWTKMKKTLITQIRTSTDSSTAAPLTTFMKRTTQASGLTQKNSILML